MTSVDGPTIGRRVAAYRRLNGWTMDELAQRTDGRVGKSVIANVETGRKHDLSVSQLVAIADGLGLPAVALMTDLEYLGNGQAGTLGELARLTGVTRQTGTRAAEAVREVIEAYRSVIDREQDMEHAEKVKESARAQMAISPRPGDPRSPEDAAAAERFELAYEDSNRAFRAMTAAHKALEAASGRLRRELGRDDGAAADSAE